MRGRGARHTVGQHAANGVERTEYNDSIARLRRSEGGVECSLRISVTSAGRILAAIARLPLLFNLC